MDPIETGLQAPRATHTPPPAPTGRAPVSGIRPTPPAAPDTATDTDQAQALPAGDAGNNEDEQDETQEVVDDGWGDDDEEGAEEADPVDPVLGVPMSELRKGYMRQQDYTAKRQLDSARVKELELELNEMRAVAPAAAEMRALLAERPETAEEVQALLARHGRAVALGQTRKADDLKAMIEEAVAPLKEQIAQSNQQRAIALVNKGKKFLLASGLKKAEVDRVYNRAFAKGEFEGAAPLVRPGMSGSQFKKALVEARSLVFPAHSQARAEKSLLKRARDVQRASATAKGGGKAPAPRPAAKPRSWDEAEAFLKGQLKAGTLTR